VKTPVYLDYHATTPVDPRALEAMLPYFTERFGNAASRNHAYGWAASDAVDAARDQVAKLIGAHHRDIVFTSGATESNNLALKGIVARADRLPAHIVTVATEHHSVLDACHALERTGVEVTVLPVDRDGLVDPARLEASLTPRTVLASVMAANNEIGVVQPLAEIAAVLHRHGVLFHTDASQAAGRMPFDVEALRVDLVSFTAHKIYGPKGVGALFVRRKGRPVAVVPQMHGGGQEHGLRAGTLNVPGIVGFGKASDICRQELTAETARIAALRDRLLAGLRERIDDVHVNGSMTYRLAHNLNVAFGGVDHDALRLAIDDLAVSFGSACATGKNTPSHVLAALRMNEDLAMTSVRFGVGRWTTAEEIDYAVEKMTTVVGALRKMPVSS
jgi:cysteine desulfurase